MEQIMSEDNYPYILSRHIEDIIYSQILLTGLDLQSSRWNRKFKPKPRGKKREGDCRQRLKMQNECREEAVIKGFR